MNWKDKTIFIGDNLHVMRGMNSDSVDLIYLDPPFNSNRNYAAPIGSQAAGSIFAYRDTSGARSTWEGDAELPDYDVGTLAGDGTHPERHRKHLPPLRSDSEPLSEVDHG